MHLEEDDRPGFEHDGVGERAEGAISVRDPQAGDVVHGLVLEGPPDAN